VVLNSHRCRLFLTTIDRSLFPNFHQDQLQIVVSRKCTDRVDDKNNYNFPSSYITSFCVAVIELIKSTELRIALCSLMPHLVGMFLSVITHGDSGNAFNY